MTIITKSQLSSILREALDNLNIKDPFWHPGSLKNAPRKIARILFLTRHKIDYKINKAGVKDVFYHIPFSINTVYSNYISGDVINKPFRPLLWELLAIFNIRITGSADKDKDFCSVSVSEKNRYFLNEVMTYFKFYSDNFEIEK